MNRVKQLWKQVFGDCGGFWEGFMKTVFVPEHCLFLEEKGQVTAALYWFDCDCGGPWAYIFAVATHPDHRGRGLCRRLMTLTHTHLREAGYHGALLVPAEPELRRMYAAMGYREAAGIAQFRCAAAEQGATLRPLNSESYADARRALLPQGGVIQEGAALKLLEKTGARFYAGENCILTAEGDHLLEYLGDKTQLPLVLAALGFREAVVRTPGTETPFAMAISLDKEAKWPEYFAFAFD